MSGEDTARVAKWSFNVSDKNIVATSDKFTFDLFKTITDNDGSLGETDIALQDGTIIAPGTSGSFDIVIENTSEVTAQYAIDYTVEKSDQSLPIQFCVSDDTWTDDLADVVANDTTKLKYANDSDDDKVTIKVKWRWAFERGADDTEKATNNSADTALGNVGTATVKVTAQVTATQVD